MPDNASANPRPEPVQRPLTLVMPVKPGEGEKLRQKIEEVAAAPGNPIETALNTVGTVHFARFVLLENDTRLAVITTYDNDFDTYVNDFIDVMHKVFNTLLQFVADVPESVARDGVEAHREEFVKYVHAHDVPYVGSFYSAYPELSVAQIVPPKAPVLT
ncbi:MAG TPA: hypothetical protein VG474_10530 [Solirubrobacteraceae bacterium]|nr:hypothetical protein [Solirubrobacteraceae bacterium]